MDERKEQFKKTQRTLWFFKDKNGDMRKQSIPTEDDCTVVRAIIHPDGTGMGFVVFIARTRWMTATTTYRECDWFIPISTGNAMREVVQKITDASDKDSIIEIGEYDETTGQGMTVERCEALKAKRIERASKKAHFRLSRGSRCRLEQRDNMYHFKITRGDVEVKAVVSHEQLVLAIDAAVLITQDEAKRMYAEKYNGVETIEHGALSP